MELKYFSTTRKTLKQVKKSSTERDKIFASYVPNKELISQKYKELGEIANTKKTMNSINMGTRI